MRKLLLLLALGLVSTSPPAAGQTKTTMKLASDSNPAVAGEWVTLTAHLVWTGPPAAGPTGIIQIKEGTQVLAELTPVADETWHTNILAPGIHKVRAFYSGDANYAPSASVAYWQAICTCPLAIVTSALPDGVVGEPYEAQLEARGGTPPYHWSLVEGALPPGLTLSDTGLISGIPAVAGRFKVPAGPSKLGASGRLLALNISAAGGPRRAPFEAQGKPRP